MKSVRILRPGVVRLTEEEIPVPKQGEALIRMRRVGICGTDHNIFRGEFSERVNFPCGRDTNGPGKSPRWAKTLPVIPSGTA